MKDLKAIIFSLICLLALSLTFCTIEAKEEYKNSEMPDAISTEYIRENAADLFAEDSVENYFFDEDSPPDPESTIEESTIEDNSNVYITINNVNLREAPGTDAARLATAPVGRSVNVLDFLDGEWYLVEYEGQQGYMKAEFLALPEQLEQSLQPYLGIEELKPLFAGRSTIAEWIKDEKYGGAYAFSIDAATGYIRLDIGFVPIVASFYIENNPGFNFLAANETKAYEALPDEILALKVVEVLNLDFEEMGIPYNIRGITKGTAVEYVKSAFLDMKREQTVYEEGAWYNYQELYNLMDVDSSITEAENSSYANSRFPYISGIVRGTDDPEFAHNCFQLIEYCHTVPREGRYAAGDARSVIQFCIDVNGKVAALRYWDLLHMN